MTYSGYSFKYKDDPSVVNNHFWEHHVVGIVSTNCYVFGNPKSAIMVDPGGIEAVQIAKKLKESGMEIKHVLVSHGHFDHLGWAAEVQKNVEGARVYLHIDEKPVYEEYLDKIRFYGLPNVELREPDIWIKDNQILSLSGYEFQILHTPGHSPGSATYLVKSLPEETDLSFIPLSKNESAFVGDCLFEGSIGRVDLPYSDKNQMLDSLNRLMNELSADTHIYPGHGNETNMKKELMHNPFLKGIQNGLSVI